VAALVAIFAIAAPRTSPAAEPDDPAEFFEKHVRPVLVESCVNCHGAQKQSSGLRLDSRAALLEGGVNGPAVVPGEPDQSLLIQAVRQTHHDIKMPPKGKLAEDQAEALAAWVQMGASWPETAPTGSSVASGSGAAARDHWAFSPVQTVTLPGVADSARLCTPVDAFILSRLETEGLSPSPPAEKRTLIRRVTIDLTGLPPTPDEVAAFLSDERPGAYERLVDRLLASPRYGERWGRFWLDVARYADTKGYVFQEERNFPYAYTYRDYVIRSFNEDKPYDRFVEEQLAADKLGPGQDPRALAALGFLTLGRRFLNVQEDIIDDRIDVVCRGLLGLTVGCARCHDHKYDPIPTEDYYSLYGVFAASVEPADLPEIPADVPEELMRDFRDQLAAKQKAVDDFAAAKLAAIQSELRGKLAAYLHAAYEIGFDGKSPKLDERAKADNLTKNRLRAIALRFKERLDTSRGANDPVFAPWHAFAALPEAEFSSRAQDAARSFASNDPSSLNLNPLIARSFADRPPTSMAEVAARYAELFVEAEQRWVEAEATGATVLADPRWEALRMVLHGPKGLIAVSSDNLQSLLERPERDALKALENDVAKLKATHPGSPPRAMVLNDVPNPTEPHVLLRGKPGNPGKQVPRQFLALLSGAGRTPFHEGSGRLELARAIASPDNPLTARVLVNRVWLNHFGAALVGTPSDFGHRSDPPTHPGLLDWLAGDFVKSGWSIKSVHRRIVLSSTYRQQSGARAELASRDPENRLYARFKRRRLDFEAVRDAMIAASGALDSTMGGRGVPISERRFPARRTVYGLIDRQNLDPVYRTFDFASPDSSSPRRIATTVPQQALFLMNSPFVIEQARRLAALAGAQESDPRLRVSRLYQRLYEREPDAGELELGVDFVQAQQQAGPSLPGPAWSYGQGRVDPATGHVADFQPFAHWTGSAWQPGASLPDPVTSYLHWDAGGGHVGVDPDHAAVLRWTAPEDMTVAIDGTLSHEAKEGDGVRARIVSSRHGVVGEWAARDAKPVTRIDRLVVKSGDTVDFVVDCQGDANYDAFAWSPTIRQADGPLAWDARADFHGPGPNGLSPWEEYAQVLLLTNEFMFVD
jgi:hypothetical protein